MIGIALVLGVPIAILVALHLVSPQRWRKASVPTFEKYNPPHKSTRCQSAERMPDGTWKWEPILEPAKRPKKFLAYNYRYSNCGGYSFFYDVDGQVLYASWSSN